MRTHILVLGLLLTSSTAALGAPHAPRKSYAIGELLFEGVSESERKLFEERAPGVIAAALTQYGALISPSTIEHAFRLQPGLRNCHEDRCFLELGDAVRAQRLFYVKLSKDGPSSWTIRLLNFSIDGARLVKTVSETCPGCNVDGVLSKLNEALDPVLRDDPAKPLCRLRVGATPSGGTVLIDRTEIGRVPFDHTVEAGTHVITVKRDGFAPGETTTECTTKLGLDFTLSMERPGVVTVQGAPSTGGQGTPAIYQPDPHRKLFLTLAGVSGGLFLASTVWLIQAAATNGDLTSCGSVQCVYRRDNSAAIGLAAAGMGVTLVAGSVLTYYGLRHHRAPSAWTVLPAPVLGGGATLQVGGRF